MMVGERRRGILMMSSALAGVALLASQSIAHAAEAAEVGNPAEKNVQFDIPAESLSQALADFSQASAKQIIFSENLVQGRKTSGLHGTYTPTQALNALLLGTDLAFETNAAGVLMVQPKKPRAALNEGAADIPTATLAAEQQSVPVAASAPEPATAPYQEIVITGSHLASGADTPTPVTSLTEADLIKASPGTLASQLREIPALMNTAGPQTYSGVKYGGASFLNLRGLDPIRTLTLVDGQRFVPTSLINAVDANIIPSALIKRVDVVTGGASATYGSDAVAGVVNFVLDNEFEGLKSTTQYGLTDHGDDNETLLSVAAGTSFANGRGHAVFSGEYYDKSGIAGGARDWQSLGHYIIPTPSGQPNYVDAFNVQHPLTYGGLLVGGQGGTPAANASFKGIMFGPGGTPSPYNFGTLTTSGTQSGGNGLDTGSYQDIDRELIRRNAYARVSYDITDSVSAYADFLYGDVSSGYILGPQQHSGSSGIVIQQDNAFLPASIKSAMAAAGVTSLLMSRADSEPGDTREHHTNDTYRGVVGVNAALGNWSLKGYYEYGFDREYTNIYNNENKAKYTLALDAVVNPATGAIVCRDALTHPTDGCQPFNPFGVGSPSLAAQNYVNGSSVQINDITENAAALNLAGDLFRLPAGPMSVAIGGEFRRESVTSNVDAVSEVSGYRVGNFHAFGAAYDIEEGYGEAEIPVLKDLTMARSLSLNGAYRFTNYSTSGSVETWKMGTVYEPIDDLRFRFTRSQDIRAPNLNELYSAGVRTSASPTDPYKGGAQLQIIDGLITGNPDLKPEIAQTYTAGLAYKPSFVRALTMTIDYYATKIKGLIATVPVQTVLNQCFAGVHLDCGSLSRDANGNLTDFTQRPINYSALSTSGFDVELNYGVPLADWFNWWRGDLTIRSLANFTENLTVAAPGLATTNYAGYTGGTTGTVSGVGSTPKFSGQTQLDYSNGPWDFLLQGRFIGEGNYFNSNAPRTQSMAKVPGAAYFDLNIQRDLDISSAKTTLYLNIRNLFDKNPVFDPNGTEFETNTNLFDEQGRVIRLGVHAQF